MSSNRVIPLGIPWTARSARRKKADFVDLDEGQLTERQLAGCITVGSRIKPSTIVNMYPDDDAPGWWYVKYRGVAGWARVREEDI